MVFGFTETDRKRPKVFARFRKVLRVRTWNRPRGISDGTEGTTSGLASVGARVWWERSSRRETGVVVVEGEEEDGNRNREAHRRWYTEASVGVVRKICHSTNRKCKRYCSSYRVSVVDRFMYFAQ